MRTLYQHCSKWLKQQKENTHSSRQQGSIIVPMAAVIFVGIVLLGSVHLGYLFYMKREMQNTANMAAVSAAQVLDPTSCTAADQVANSTVTQNMGATVDTVTVQCGDWDPTINPGPHHFASQTSDLNAVYVKLEHEYTPIMPFMKMTTLVADAVAYSEEADQIAAFSVGPQLLNLDNGILTNLLAGIGVDLRGTSVLDYQGLANVKITPSGLLKQLGIEVPADITVGSLNELLKADIGVKALVDVLSASISAANQDGLLSVEQVKLLELIELGIKPLDLHLQLFGDAIKNGLFVLVSSPGQPNYDDAKDKKAGLDAEVSLGDVLNVVLGVANQKNAVALGGPDGNLLNLGIIQVLAKASVIEPPAIGIGGIGTQAHSSNIRVFLRICVDLGGCSKSGSSLGFLSSIIQLKLDLPVVLELVNATGRIENMCYAKDEATQYDKIDLSVKTETAGVCIGKFSLNEDESSIHYPFSGLESCTIKISPDGQSINPDFKTELLNISLLGLNLARLNDAVAIPALTAKETQAFIYHTADDERHLNTKMMPEHGNPLMIGDTVKQLTDAVLALVVGSSLGSNMSVPSSITKILAEDIWNSHKYKTDDQGNFLDAAGNILPNYQRDAQGNFIDNQGNIIENPHKDKVQTCNVSEKKCRENIYTSAKNEMESSISGLQGFLGDLLGPVLGLLGDLVTLNIASLLNNVGNLLGNILGGVGEVLVGDGCYKGGILGGLFGQNGNEAGCQANLSELMSKTSDGKPNALLVLIGQLIKILTAPLNDIGSKILSPLLEALGLNVGQAETTVLYLDCQPNVKLVY